MYPKNALELVGSSHWEHDNIQCQVTRTDFITLIDQEKELKVEMSGPNKPAAAIGGNKHMGLEIS